MPGSAAAPRGELKVATERGPSVVPPPPVPARVATAPPAVTVRSRLLKTSTTRREPSGRRARLSAPLKRALAPVPSWYPAAPLPATAATAQPAGSAVGEGVGEGGAPGEGEAEGVPEAEGGGQVSARSAWPEAPVSHTTSAPLGSTATPRGALNVASPRGPLALPATPVPANVTSAPLAASMARRRLLPWSATHSVAPSAESASAAGLDSVPTPRPPSAV